MPDDGTDQTDQTDHGGPAPRTYRTSRGRRLGDALVGWLALAGVVPHTYLLATRGRKSGRRRTNPVTSIDRDGRRWLVAPYGVVSWVHNARASGQVTLRRRWTSIDCTIREARPEEAGPVLKQYIGIARPTRPYFRATLDDPVQQFVAEAHRHPVFELIPIG